MGKTSISYLEGFKIWNFIQGCQKISSECKFCWSDGMQKRFNPGSEFSDITYSLEKLHIKLPEKPSKIAVCFTSDIGLMSSNSNRQWQNGHDNLMLSHAGVDERALIQTQFFNIMRDNPNHLFICLTKRPRMLWAWENCTGSQLRNIWLGTTIGCETSQYRANELLEVKSRFPNIHPWLSIEPLIGPVNPEICKGMEFVVVGGESGAGARTMDIEWVRPIRDYCLDNRIMFYFKQYAGREKSILLDGVEYRETPWKFHVNKG